MPPFAIGALAARGSFQSFPPRVADPEDETARVVHKAKELRPQVVFDVNETALPCSVEHYFARARVVNSDGTAVTQWGDATPTTILPYSNTHSLEYNNAEPYAPDNLNEIPMYCHVTKLRNGEYRFQYWMLYTYNPFCCSVGTHPADWERCSIYTDAAMVPQRIRVSAHGDQECQWYEWNKLKLEQGAPFLRASKGSHALHAVTSAERGVCCPTPRICCRIGGCYCLPRLCCFANDTIKVTTHSRRWTGQEVVMITSATPWVAFEGDWGYNRKTRKSHVSGVARRSYWHGLENPFSATSCLTPCLYLPLRKLFPSCFDADYSCRFTCNTTTPRDDGPGA